MAEEQAAERTEEPSSRKLSKAREDGQVARSTELPAAVVTIGAFLLFMLMGGWLLSGLATVFASGFVFDRRTLESPHLLPTAFAAQLSEGFVYLLPLIVLTVVLAIVSSGLTGGYLFSLKSIQPKPGKLNPINGLKRIFGPAAFVELGKAILKFVLVASVLWWSIAINMDTLVNMGRMSLEPALWAAGSLIAQSAIYVALSLAIIAAIDVPYQKHQFMKRMRMTKQEVRDEMKDIEGRPEVKAQIRRRQREMANARMMQRVKDADVVITNPEHFAIALEYDPSGDGAPTLIAKGVDHMAQRIREEAALHGVHLFAAPPLARALYFTTKLDQPIPEELYHAVAQVIAYVYSLEGIQTGRKPMDRPSPVVPDSMRFDQDGNNPRDLH